MPNRNYRKGYRLENKLVKGLRAGVRGLVFRTAGSHTAADVVAFDIKGGDEGWIGIFQCKTNKKLYDKSQEQQMKDNLLRALASVKSWELRVYNTWPDREEPMGIHFERITLD